VGQELAVLLRVLLKLLLMTSPLEQLAGALFCSIHAVVSAGVEDNFSLAVPDANNTAKAAKRVPTNYLFSVGS
jgi:hypothetical protein